MTRDDLAKFRSGFASCELVLLADIASGTVLISDCAIRVGQEHLDALCQTAVRLFDPAAALAARVAVISGPSGCRVFLRAPAPAAEALCCHFAPGAAIADLEAASQFLFHQESH